jgi:hypothetical protein
MAVYAYFQDQPEETTKYQTTKKSALHDARIVTVNNLKYNEQLNDKRPPGPTEAAKTPLPYGMFTFLSQERYTH